MISFAATDIGQVRKINEDAYYIAPENRGLYIVADGMGGHQAGEVASALAIETLSAFLCEYLNGTVLSDSSTDQVMREAIEKTNQTIYSLATSNAGYSGMGTTVVACMIRDGSACIGHIGDSRAYLLREGILSQLTTDHSLVQELLSKGRITEAEAADHPRKNILTRALGTDPVVESDVQNLLMQEGDILMLCTDGITNHVHTQEMHDILSGNPPEKACSELIKQANSRGGFDNMTVLIIENTPAQEGSQ